MLFCSLNDVLNIVTITFQQRCKKLKLLHFFIKTFISFSNSIPQFEPAEVGKIRLLNSINLDKSI